MEREPLLPKRPAKKGIGNGTKAFVVCVVLALFVGGIGILVWLLTKRKSGAGSPGSPGNWTAAQIAEKAALFSQRVPPILAGAMSPEELAKAVECGVTKLSLLYAADDDCFKKGSCAFDPSIMIKCLGGDKGSWSAGLKAIMVNSVPNTMPREAARCMVEALSQNYSFSDMTTELQRASLSATTPDLSYQLLPPALRSAFEESCAPLMSAS
jgi:hypothetical protein